MDQGAVQEPRRLIRIERMHRPGITRGIITDASPKGWGAVLVAIDKEDDTIWEPLEAVEALISKTEAELLNVEFGEASSQAVMEAYAILRAIDKWGHDWAGRGVMIRSDSTVALAMMQKLGSSHAALNFLAAEISVRLEKFEVQRLVHQHIRGYPNEEADYLSRLAERKDKKKPAGLEGSAVGEGRKVSLAATRTEASSRHPAIHPRRRSVRGPLLEKASLVW